MDAQKIDDPINPNSMVAVDNDLVIAVEEALRRRGVLNKMKAQMRAEVFHALQDKTLVFPDKPPDVFLATELIREFLTIFKLQNTLSVFCEEMGQPFDMTLDRQFIGNELGLNTTGSNEQIPLMVYLVQYLKKNREEYLKNIDNTHKEREKENESV